MKKKDEIEYWELDKKKYKKLQELKKKGKIKGNICPCSYFTRKVIKNKPLKKMVVTFKKN